jgi:ribosome-associated toxin RatA of RatAB toxin-antitoxin module
MHVLKPVIISISLLFHAALSFAQQDWKLSTDKDGIKVFTSDIASSKIKALKVTCTLAAQPSQLVALLLDVESAPEWIYHTKSCKLIKQVSPSELYYYSEVSVPWPVENRDFVAHLIVRQNPETKVVTIDGPAVSGFVPIKDGVVRISESKGRWQISPLPNNQIQVEYTLHVNPGGNLPPWLVNMFASQGPLEIFRKMKIMLKQPRYKSAEFAFIRN